MSTPNFLDRNPDQILEETNFFESSGRTYKALSWLDYAKKNRNVSALEYAALEARMAIEQLLFEQIIIGVGTELDATNYKKCSGSAKDLSKVIQKLIPRYEKLVDFTIAMAPPGIPITKWDNQALIRFSGRVSTYLHWTGGIDSTIQSPRWLTEGIAVVEEAASYIWNGLTRGNTGVMQLHKLEPEMFELWELFFEDKISLTAAVSRADALESILRARIDQASATKK